MGHKHLGKLGPVFEELTNAQISLAVAILWHVPDDKNLLNATTRTIGEWSGRTASSVIELLPALIEVGLLDVVEPPRPRIRGLYRLADCAGEPRTYAGEPDKGEPRTYAGDPRPYAGDPRVGIDQEDDDDLTAAIAEATKRGVAHPKAYALKMLENGWRASKPPPKIPAPEECDHPAPWAQLDDCHRCRLCSEQWPMDTLPPAPKVAL
jgi:hypothetical protein